MLRRLLLLAVLALMMTTGACGAALAAGDDPAGEDPAGLEAGLEEAGTLLDGTGVEAPAAGAGDAAGEAQEEQDAILAAYDEAVGAIDARVSASAERLEAGATAAEREFDQALAAADTEAEARAAFAGAERAMRALVADLGAMFDQAAADLEAAGTTAADDLAGAGAPEELIQEVRTSASEGASALRAGKQAAQEELEAAVGELHDQLDTLLASFEEEPPAEPQPEPAPEPAPEPRPVPVQAAGPAQLPFTGSSAALLLPAGLAVLGTGLIVVLAVRRHPAD